MRSYNRYGCIPGQRCACPVSFARCSAFETMDRLAAEGDAQAAADRAAFDAATAARMARSKARR